MSVQAWGLAVQVPVWSPAPHMALSANLQNSPSSQPVPSKPPQVLPLGLLVVPAVPFMQSPALGQSSPTVPALLPPLAASDSGDSARMGNSQAQWVRAILRGILLRIDITFLLHSPRDSADSLALARSRSFLSNPEG